MVSVRKFKKDTTLYFFLNRESYRGFVFLPSFLQIQIVYIDREAADKLAVPFNPLWTPEWLVIPPSLLGVHVSSFFILKKTCGMVVREVINLDLRLQSINASTSKMIVPHIVV